MFKTSPAALTLALCALISTLGQQPVASGAAPAMRVPTYPDSPEGLKSFIQDLLIAIRAKKDQKVAAFLHELIIPDHAAWFANVFGPEEGKKLSGQYERGLSDFKRNTRSYFEYVAREGGSETEVKKLQKRLAPEADSLARAVVEAMREPVPFYFAERVDLRGGRRIFVGYFIHVDNGFRYVDSIVFHALSTAPPLRIRIGGNVAQAGIVHRVQPTYPEEAKDSGVEGQVILRAIIGRDGSIKELTVIQGAPPLAAAAVEAVRQWRYQPTLLNGLAVEVVTTITVDFHPRRR